MTFYDVRMSILATGYVLLPRFTHPEYLLLLTLLPVFLLIGLRSLAGLGAVRRRLALGARCAVLALFVLALAGPEHVRISDDQTVIFAIDRSSSVPRERQQAALEYARAAALEMRPGKDRVAVIAFDGASAVEQLASEEMRVDQLGAGVRPYQTNLAGTLRMALALFPPDSARRVVVLSDGNENVGSGLEEAERYAAAGVPADVVPLRYERAHEMLIERLSAPANAKLDETVDLSLVVRSQAEATARVLLYHNDALVDLDPSPANAGYAIHLEPGHNRFTIPVPLRSGGVHRFRAVLQAERAEDDAVAANNEGRTFTMVGRAERILILSDSAGAAAEKAEIAERNPEHLATGDGSAEILAAALRQAGIECELGEIGAKSLDPVELADCSLVILNNIPAYAMSDAQQRALTSYVRDLSGGLIAVGGDRAFSVGGYYHTPLDEVLPVETNRAKLKQLSLAMVLVIDRSGSMAGEKISMARDAASGTVSLLSSKDQLGVIAFHSGWEWIVPLAQCENKLAIQARLARIGGGGGTDMCPAMEQAAAALAGVDVNLRHMIVLTDGQSTPGDFLNLAERCGKAGITITTIAVGMDADQSLLGDIARVSGGRMYRTNSAQPLPRIFIRETMLASRTGIYERPFSPQLSTGPAERIVRGFTQADIPPLEGYVITSAKPLATAPLVRTHAEGTDPILAYWQVGLGRVAAVTTGLWPRWGPGWMQWPGFSKFWAQCVRYAARSGLASDFQVTTNVENEQAKIVLEARGLSPAELESISFAGQMVGPSYEAAPFHVTRTGPDRFEGTFPVSTPGVYLTSLAYCVGAGPEAAARTLQTGVVVTYSPEHSAVAPDEVLLEELARRTGGRVLDPAYPQSAFEPWSIRPVEARLPIWKMLVRLALAAFLLDVAVRRLAIDPAETLKRARLWVRELAGRPVSAGAVATVATLRGARERLRDERAADAAGSAAQSTTVSALKNDTSPIPLDATPNQEDAAAQDDLSRALGGESDRPAVAPPRQPGRPATENEADYTSRLLRAKRAARERTREDGDAK